MRKKDWLKFLRIIFYFLAIISLALSIMGRMARAAESLPDNIETIIEEDLANYNQVTTQLQSYYLTIESFATNVLRLEYNNCVFYLFFPSNFIGLADGGNSSYQLGNAITGYFCNLTSYCPISTHNNTVSQGQIFMMELCISSNYVGLYYNTFARSSSGWWDWYSYNNTLYDAISPYSALNEVVNLYYRGSSNNNFGGGYSPYHLGSNNLGFCNFIGASDYCSNEDIFIEGSTAYTYKYANNWEERYPSAVEDSRLKLDTIISSGRKELVVDMSLFCDDLLASSYNISDFVLTLDYDGVEQTFDNLGEYISVYASSTGRDCFAIIPYSEFGFDDNNNISDILVSVTKVSFSTNALYPNRPTVIESYQIATSYYLKNDLDNNIDWDDTNVIENPNETIQYDGDDFNDLKISLENPEMQDHGTIYNDWHYVSSLPVWEGWESIYNVDIFTFSDAFDVEHTWYHVRADFDSSLVQQFGIYYYVPFKISNWLYDNAISNYYDVLVFKNYHGKYEDVDITAPNDYLIFYSNRYYLKKHILELGNVHKTVSSIGNQIYTLYDFTYKRMNDINGNIQKGFENVLSKDNAIIGLLSSVNFNLDKFGNMINSNLVSVISGLNGLKGSGGRDLTDIYNRLGNMITSVDLTGILTNLFVPTYTGFQDSFDDAIDSMGILALPFDVSKRFITASRVPYSSTLNVTFPEYEFNNLQYWDEYEFEFNPNSILSADWLEFLQYCNALFVIVTVTLLTYKHIFASPVSEESGIL